MGDDGIEWELEDLDGGVLYDVFYESTTMLAGRMLAQRRLAAARGDRDGERRAEAADARMRLARIGSLRSVPGVGTALSDPVVASIRRSLDDLA